MISMVTKHVLARLHRFHEKRLLNFYRNYFHSRSLVFNTAFDVGAHIGESIDLFLKINKSVTIHSFEANPKHAASLLEKYKDDRVTVHAVGLSNREEDKVFYVNVLSSTSSFHRFNSASQWTKFKAFMLGEKLESLVQEEIVVRTVSLDSVLHDIGQDKIDVLKIDTEGHELEVLIGAQQALSNRIFRLIQIENHLSELYGESNYTRIHKLLTDNGYEVIKKFWYPLHPLEDIIFELRTEK